MNCCLMPSTTRFILYDRLIGRRVPLWKTKIRHLYTGRCGGNIKTGKARYGHRVHQVCRGRPVYQLEYGKSNVKLGTANLASALGAHDSKYYADKSGEDYVPTFFIDGCIHGGEFEGTMAVPNLIKLLETGTDYAGQVPPRASGSDEPSAPDPDFGEQSGRKEQSTLCFLCGKDVL